MNKNIKLLIESFFDDVENDIYNSEEDNNMFHQTETSKLLWDELINDEQTNKYNNLTKYPKNLTIDNIDRYKIGIQIVNTLFDIYKLTNQVIYISF